MASPPCRTCGYSGGCPPSHVIDNTGDADTLWERAHPLRTWRERMAVIPDELRCGKCGGAGWMWSHEREGGGGDRADDTKYSCDSCDGSGRKADGEMP